jgi:hypothetical protein
MFRITMLAALNAQLKAGKIDKDQYHAARSVLRNNAQTAVLRDEVCNALGLSEAPGDWQSFLQWIIEHGPEIMAFIQMIIALFSTI